MTKKRIFIFFFLLALILCGALVSWFFISQRDGMRPDEIGRSGFFPFGRDTARNSGNEDVQKNTSQNSSDGIITVPFEQLVQISSTPVTGMNLDTRGTQIFTQYMERPTGHIYETSLNDLSKGRLSQATMPGIRESWWTNTSTIILRYLRKEESSIATLISRTPRPEQQTASSTEISGEFLSENIIDMILSLDGKKIFYTQKSEDNAELFGFFGDAPGLSAKNVFRSAFTEWLPVALDGKNVWLQTKASYATPGSLYRLEIASGNFVKVLGNIRGLTALPSPNGERILYSESTRGLFQTFIYDIKKGEKTHFPVATLPEKCVWGSGNMLYCLVPQNPKTAKYPDEWYQSTISFSDTIWSVNAETLESTIIFDVLGGGKTIDGVRPMISKDSFVLLFINKKDSSLWAYRSKDLQ